MNRIDFSNLGGNPMDEQSFDFMQTAYSEPLAAIAALCGNKVIVSGMVIVGANISDGWISYNGELIKFLGGPLSAGVVVQETATYSPVFQDTTVHDVEFQKVATCGAPATFPFSDLVRLSTLQNMWLSGDVKLLQQTMAYIVANFDGTGLGIGERAGWKVCNGQNGTVNMADKLPLGYDWNNIAGLVSEVGSERGSSTIAQTNLPASMALQVRGKMIKKGGTDNGVTVLDVDVVGGAPADASFGTNDVNTTLTNGGGGQAYLPDSIVMLYIVKI